MNPKTLLTATLTAIVLAATLAPAAHADYFIGRHVAESFMRTEVNDRYVVEGNLGVFCRPQGARAPERGYIYHRWTCTWADDTTWGVLLIAGSGRGRDWYHVRLVKGMTPLTFRD